MGEQIVQTQVDTLREYIAYKWDIMANVNVGSKLDNFTDVFMAYNHTENARTAFSDHLVESKNKCGTVTLTIHCAHQTTERRTWEMETTVIW